MNRLILAGPLVAIATAALGQAPTRAEVDAYGKGFDAALMHKDAAWLEKTTGKNYFEISTTGAKTTRAQSINDSKRTWTTIRLIGMKTYVTSFKTKGNQAIAGMRMELTGYMMGSVRRRNVLRVIDDYDAAYAKEKGQIQILWQRETNRKTLIDGEEVKRRRK